MIDDTEWHWREYQALREEIRDADRANYQVLGILIAAAVAVVTAGFGQRDPSARLVIFASVYLLTYLGLRFLRGNRARTWRISTYMRVFLEPALPKVKWETRLSAQRKQARGNRERKQFSSGIITNEAAVAVVLNLFAAVAMIVGGLIPLYTLGGKSSWWVVLWSGLVTLVNIAFIIAIWLKDRSMQRRGKVEQHFLQSWQQLDNEEQSQHRPATDHE